MIAMPRPGHGSYAHESTGNTGNLTRPFFGPYHVLNLTSINPEVRLVDKPDEPSIFNSLDRVSPCYSELPNRSWSGHTSKHKRKKKSNKTVVESPTLPELIFRFYDKVTYSTGQKTEM